MDESIWPSKIDDVSDVVDYKMVYYNPWDAQYLGYLVIDYTPDDYASEISRLKEYPSTDYIGYYSVIEEKTYELLAIYADEYNGFVYALTDGKNRTHPQGAGCQGQAENKAVSDRKSKRPPK